METLKDEGLQGNEKIEEAILELQKGADAGTAGTRADGNPPQNEKRTDRRFFPWNRHPATIRSGSER